MALSASEKTAAESFELYRQLTYELKKFIDRGDIDSFLALTNQRADLVEAMEKDPACEAYRQSPAMDKLREEIVPIDREILYKAKAWLNKSRRQNTTVRTYEATELGIEPAGNILNRKY